jgi:hypothetical protein
MEREILYWARYNYAISSFCQDILLRDKSNEEIVEVLTGDGKNPKWYSESSSFVFLIDK